MKKYKKLLLLMVCTGVIGSMTACGRNKDTDGADQTDTENVGNTNRDENMNDATGGNKNNTNRTAIMEPVQITEPPTETTETA